MRLPGPFCALLASIGTIQSEYLCWSIEHHCCLRLGRHRIKAKLKSGEMYVRGDQWPLFLYDNSQFDPEDPWKGLLCSNLLILVCHGLTFVHCTTYLRVLQACKHIFTSPSSVDHDEPKATRSGNAHIHGMACVTKGSLAYVATQVITSKRKPALKLIH
jgi:hypothetical protein